MVTLFIIHETIVFFKEIIAEIRLNDDVENVMIGSGRVIVLQGGKPPGLEQEGRWCR